ncbi:phospholipase A2 inhibitor and Ly6/PLAUR domain-containing protein-like isoform X1 [Heteronotia binoei]|uniref:phospholipase A2 inhibitor and Ly6/PLAUR domain-containing protein-like isoform X1 n=1 Tax=Heteronotia binoei TaxID=13085 RepID=UPI002931C163|nr:phospholipase A2 inhibitor and Ly6/PLAUR domain-containing protein-like isoform X1 [Heteronotia binoei]
MWAATREEAEVLCLGSLKLVYMRLSDCKNRTALQCEICTGLGHNCTGKTETCPPGHDFCGTTLFESKQEEILVHGIIKNCIPSSVCAAGSSDINLGEKGRSRTHVFCCQGDTCNAATAAKFMPSEAKLNGLQCPACYASLDESCNDADIVNCVGSEFQCIDLAGYVHYDESSQRIAMKGCATESVCSASVGGAATFAGVSSAITKLECSPASSKAVISPGPSGLLLSAVVGFLLVKF